MTFYNIFLIGHYDLIDLKLGLRIAKDIDAPATTYFLVYL